MSSLSSRFSSVSSTHGKAFHPPKPTYNSPKLVREPILASSSSHENLRSAHPFATSSYGARRRAPTEPRKYRSSEATIPNKESQSEAPHTFEFGSLRNDSKLTDLASDRASLMHAGSFVSQHDEMDSIGRPRSSTVGSKCVDLSNLGPLNDLPHTPNPFKSQFDDSDDEERLDVASRSLSGVPNRARLAALGTASRLFKGRRHSRTSSSSMTNEASVPAPLQLDKRSSKQHDGSLSRPSTSDGKSPAPRQAVFGHRPSPSELSLPSRPDKTRSVAPVDRDLILSLKGGPLKPARPKTADRKKLLPKTLEHQRESENATVSVVDGKAHWMDPPPYCVNESEVMRRESLRKSQSLSTLRFDPSRRPRQPSPVSELEEHPQGPALRHVDRSAWETMFIESPDTVSDHSSLSSCGRVIKTELIPDSPPKRLLKAQRLPPQKPPPQTELPPPPPHAPDSCSKPRCSGLRRLSLKVCDSGPSPATSTSTVQTLELPSHSTSPPAIVRPVRSSSPVRSKPSSPKESQTMEDTSALPWQVHPAEMNSTVTLDVGGTKFVTLVSTLQGKPGDQPRLLDYLHCREEAQTEAALCRDTHLIRRKRVDVTHRVTPERSDSDHSTQDSRIFTTVDEASTAEQLSSKLDSVLSLGMESRGSSSSTSLSTSAFGSGSESQLESDTSTRRTSDVSNASEWSKSAPEGGNDVEAADATSGDAQELLPAEDKGWHNALPSSRICSPQSPFVAIHPSSPGDGTATTRQNFIFLDRNGDLYRDILDILRTSKLPYRLQAASLVASSSSSSFSIGSNCSSSCTDEEGRGLTALKLQLRCRLHEVKEEAEWLGYHVIVTRCEQEILLL